MNFSAPFVVRPIATTLLMIGVTLLGLVAYALLPIAGVPQIDIPTIRVTATLPGANAETMATSVATPLERQLALISSVTSISSTSSLGKTSIQVEFDLNRNIDGAAQDVQSGSSQLRGAGFRDDRDRELEVFLLFRDASARAIRLGCTRFRQMKIVNVTISKNALVFQRKLVDRNERNRFWCFGTRDKTRHWSLEPVASANAKRHAKCKRQSR